VGIVAVGGRGQGTLYRKCPGMERTLFSAAQ
jgi:hypothetical protein